MQANAIKSPAEVAAVLGCTEEQARTQMARNAAGLRDDYLRACARGGKLRGIEAEWFLEQALCFEAALAVQS